MNNDFEHNFYHSCQPPRLATVEVFFGSWRVNRRFAANPTHAVPHAVAADPKFEFLAKKTNCRTKSWIIHSADIWVTDGKCGKVIKKAKD